MNKRPEKAIPVVRGDRLLVERVGDETVIYDPERTEAHCLSPFAASVFAHCNGESSVELIAEQVGADLGEPVRIEDVETALAQLEERDLVTTHGPGTSRREMLRRTGAVAAAAMSVPLVTSVVMPTAALAAGGCPIGTPCTTDSDCTHAPGGHPSCLPTGTCSCGPCTIGGNKVCSVHDGSVSPKCSEPCEFGGGSLGGPCANCGT